MSETGMSHDRRLHPRISLKNRGVTVIRPGMVMQCSVDDISLGGLSFVYAGSVDWRNSEACLDFIDGLLHLNGIKVRIVSDKPVQRGSWAANGGPAWRRCGVEFLSLSEHQHQQLDEYIAMVSRQD